MWPLRLLMYTRCLQWEVVFILSHVCLVHNYVRYTFVSRTWWVRDMSLMTTTYVTCLYPVLDESLTCHSRLICHAIINVIQPCTRSEVAKRNPGSLHTLLNQKLKQVRRSPRLKPQPTPETIPFAGSAQEISDFSAYLTELLQLPDNVLYKAVHPDTVELVNSPKLLHNTKSSEWGKESSK